MKRIVAHLWLAALVLAGCSLRAESPEKLSIILMMADDLGWGNVGFNGQAHIQRADLRIV